MKRFLFAMIALVAASVATQAAAFDTPAWSSCVTVDNSSSFDTCELTFPAQPASRVVSINNPAAGYYHGHGTGATHSLEVHVDGIWQSVFSNSSAVDETISAIATPLNFSGGSVDGIRFTVDMAVGQAYHGVDSAMTFTLDNQGPQVAAAPGTQSIPALPPGALLLLVLLIAGAGLYGRRHLRNVA